MLEVNLKRTALNVAGCCNLRCKDCLAFIPYYKKRWIMSYSEASKVIEKYFQVVDTVNTFTITGGEPLLNPEIGKILNEVNKYKNQVNISIDFVTNASLNIPEEVLDFFESNKEHARIILSNYGEDLSVKIDDIEKELIRRNITYRISKFSGSDLYYDGWIDFSDHTLKHKTLQERDEYAAKCVHGAGKYFVINDGCIHRCSRSYWRIKNGIIPAVEGEYVPLMDDALSLEKKKELLVGMVHQVSTTSCAHCVGLRNDVPRVKPAIQLKR